MILYYLSSLFQPVLLIISIYLHRFVSPETMCISGILPSQIVFHAVTDKY